MKYGPDARREAVKAIKRHGSVRKAATATGIPKSTLHDFLARNLPDDPGYVPGVDPLKVRADERTILGYDGTNQPLPDEPPDEITREDARAGELVDAENPEGSILSNLDDPLYLRAFARYAGLRINGVHDVYAMPAARQVHSGFDLTVIEHDRLNQAMNSMQFSEGGPQRLQMAALAPPSYVRSVYDQFAMDENSISELAANLLDTYKAAYVTGINDQLTAAGRVDRHITSVTDNEILSNLNSDAGYWATSIADVWNRELAGYVGTEWLSLSAQRGSQMSRQWLQDSVDGWVADRSEWKAMQIAVTEAGRAYNNAGMDFNAKNPQADGVASVVPSAAECLVCQQMVAKGLVPGNDAVALFDVPAHPGCPHFIEWSYTEVLTGQIWTAQDTNDEAAA